MIANVHPGLDHFEDSNNTLEYAKRASTVRAPVLVRRDVPREAPREALREPRSSANSVPARGRPRGHASPPLSPGEARRMLLQDVSFELGTPGTPCRNLRRPECGGENWESSNMPAGSGVEATRACRPRRRERASTSSTPSCPAAPRQRASSMPRASTAGRPTAIRRTSAASARAVAENSSGGQSSPDSDVNTPSKRQSLLRDPLGESTLDMPPCTPQRGLKDALASETAAGALNTLDLEATSLTPFPPARAQPQSPCAYRARVADISGSPVVGSSGIGTEGGGRDQVMLRIVESLQAEKAAMDEQMRAVMAERDRLEAECARLRDANLEKDRQLAGVLSSKAPVQVRCHHCGAWATG